jgi:hypothetical protein
MTDFAANIHFRSVTQRNADGAAGGYGWFLGRYSGWSDFECAIQGQLHELGFYYVECLKLLELSSIDDLNPGEQRQLYTMLDVRPIQWGTLHIYPHDDA